MSEHVGTPAGVGGWLVFFLIGLGLLSPLMVIVSLVGLYSDPQIAAAYGDTWPVLEMFEWLLTAGQLALLWFMTWRLLRVHVWQTVRIVIVGIWTAAIAIPILEIVGISLISGIAFDAIAAGLVPEFIRGLIYCAIWTAYFLRSERVSNTYLRAANPDEMAEVFS